MRWAVAAALALFAALAVAGCGGDHSAKARDLYGDYRTTNEERLGSERRLRKAVSDLAEAAGERDRPSALDAIARGKHAAAEAERLLAAEIALAAALGDLDVSSAEGRRLEKALRTSREGLRLVVRELAIGGADPFLDRERNRKEVKRLARRSTTLGVEGEFARRRAAHALALALDVEPPFDPLFDVVTGPETTTSAS